MKSFYPSIAFLLFFIPIISIAQVANLNVTYQGNVPNVSGHTMANICGYTDSLGNEYALCGVDNGMTIVDVTVPNNPIQLLQIPDVTNEWKEIKVYHKFAYVTTEGGGGVQIIDLHPLPNTNLPVHNYTGDGAIAGQLNTIHTLHVDTTKGFLYVHGSNLFGGGSVVLDLNADPYNPHYVGHYQNPQYNYVHDGYVDDDTLYAAHIYAGVLCIVDMTNKNSPVVLGTQQTTTACTHNTWPSNGKQYVFTTDENANSFLTCYDISNPSNIQVTDKIQSQYPNSGSIVHNTHIKNNWAITSWYRDGFVITDITRPYNLVNVGWYDTYTPATNGGGSAGPGNGFNGTWGVFPFFPSGTIVCSNIEDGLYVFTPTYVRACYIEGTVKDSLCNTPVHGVTITISTVNVSDQSDLSGVIRTGTAFPGTYNVTFTKPGYVPYVMNNVVFSPGVVDTFNIKMYAANTISIAGHAENSITTSAMQNVQVSYSNANENYNYVSNSSGNFSNCSMVSATYQIEAAIWGSKEICMSDSISSANASQNFQLIPGYQDEFSFNLGWSTATTASTGAWERGVPIGTTFATTNDCNPGNDASDDCGNQCYVTGNAGGTYGQDDVDDGATTLTSPNMDLTTYNDPWINYERWFFDAGGTGNPNDSLIVRLTDGTTTKILEIATASTIGNSSWVHKSFQVSNYFTPTATMKLSVYVVDAPPDNVVEGGFDNFSVNDSILGIQNHLLTNGISVYPNPFNGNTTIHFAMQSSPANGAFLEVKDISGRSVLTQPVTTQEGTIELGSDLSAGIYFVRMVNGNELTKSVRLVKTR